MVPLRPMAERRAPRVVPDIRQGPATRRPRDPNLGRRGPRSQIPGHRLRPRPPLRRRQYHRRPQWNRKSWLRPPNSRRLRAAGAGDTRAGRDNPEYVMLEPVT